MPNPQQRGYIPAPGQTVRILLLEDDPISVEIVGTYLRRISFADVALHSAVTMADALAVLAKAEVDLVVADLHLPDSNGAATIATLVQSVGCPVIAITADRDPGMRDATLACGAFEFLQKDDLTETTLMRLVRLAMMQADTSRSLRESREAEAALRESEGRLAYLAQFDPLTGLPNRALLADRFAQMIVHAKRRSAPVAVLFIDLDGFKAVNDTLGHAGGDRLLKEVALRLQSSVRSEDTVARISGDEFAIVLPDLSRPDDAGLVAQKVIESLAQAIDIQGSEIFVTASVGIAAYPADGLDAETLIGAADAAMYRAKQTGRNAYQFFTAEINQRSRARVQLGAELRRALEREEFALFYQPKYQLATRRPVGAEALLRWNHPDRGPVAPSEFIPVLEETGLIVPVGEWAIQRACHDLKAWQRAGSEVGAVSVNLSARQFRQHDLDARIKSIVSAAAVDPQLVELEITESQLMADPDHGVRLMRTLCEAGLRIAIDDFGTGYSSLAYLTRFPVSALKIDRSFVRDMSRDKTDATIVRTIIEMAHSLDFTVIAEGVETEEQASLLQLLRCEQAQGYLFMQPLPAHRISRLREGLEVRLRLASNTGDALRGARKHREGPAL